MDTLCTRRLLRSCNVVDSEAPKIAAAVGSYNQILALTVDKVGDGTYLLTGRFLFPLAHTADSTVRHRCQSSSTFSGCVAHMHV